jgi:hypothetical protein
MRKSHLFAAGVFVLVFAFAEIPVFTQQQPSEKSEKQRPQQQKTEKRPAVAESPAQRLASAKSVYVVRLSGGDIPFDTIRTTMEGWERFKFVDSADKADLIIEVSSNGGDNDVRVSSGMNPSPQTGRMEQSTSSSKDISATQVSMLVSDARNKRVLWRGTESAKYAMRQKARENNLVEAAERLASKFHDRLEPPMGR